MAIFESSFLFKVLKSLRKRLIIRADHDLGQTNISLHSYFKEKLSLAVIYPNIPTCWAPFLCQKYSFLTNFFLSSGEIRPYVEETTREGGRRGQIPPSSDAGPD